METIRIPTTTASTPDELGTTKAAAWAWYQRGIGSEDKSLEEIRTRRIHQVPRPSRFKLEAMRIIANTESLQENSEKSLVDSRILSSPTNHSDISLFDAYEIEMISKQFDSLTKHARDTYHHHHQPYINHNHHQDPGKRTPVLQGNAISSSIKKNTTKIWNGFWLGKPAARICGSSGDVVEPRKLAGNTDKGKIKQSAPQRRSRSHSGDRKSG